MKILSWIDLQLKLMVTRQKSYTPKRYDKKPARVSDFLFFQEMSDIFRVSNLFLILYLMQNWYLFHKQGLFDIGVV